MDFVQKSGLRRILFDKSCLRRIYFHQKSGLRQIYFITNLPNHSGMHLIWSFLFCLPIRWWWKWLKRSVQKKWFCSSWVTWRNRDSGEKTTWTKQSLSQRYVCVGCHLNSNQELRLHCLKGHVRACDSTLWRSITLSGSEWILVY